MCNLHNGYYLNVHLAAQKKNNAIPSIESRDGLENLMENSQLQFASGLLGTLQYSSPPLLTDFQGLPEKPTDQWGVYLLILEKTNERPQIYVVSGTHSSDGVAFRWNQYTYHQKLPRYLSKALEDGYTLSSKELLC